jgi:hypothetical protein
MKKLFKYLLVLIGLYILYNIVGLVLINTGVVSEWVVAPNTAIKNSGHDKDDSKAGADGPYVFYAGDSIIVKSIVNKDSALTVLVNSFHNNQKDSITISCTLSGHPQWGFSTKLKSLPAKERCEYTASPALIAISDIEGEFAAFRKLLIANKVMSEDYKWVFGNGHLVLVGDFFDRGLNVTECLWLIYHLEQEAEKAGGKVHFILGNHEIMNMGCDTRYVKNKYTENALRLDAPYDTWFTPNTELGRWLLTKNVVEKIGSLLFTHGGFSKEFNELSLPLDKVNDICRAHYCTRDSLRRHSLTGDEEILFSSKHAPFWNRDYVNEDADKEQIETTLKLYNASAIVVGHTVVKQVKKLYNGKVIAIDTKHADGNSQGVFYNENKFYSIDTTGARKEL